MNNKVALVTGGSDGVGLSIVGALVQAKYDVYFIGSNPTKGESVLKTLKQQAGKNHKAVIEFIPLDLSDLKAVKAFADGFLKKVQRLDVLLFSAGVLLPKRLESAQGFERTLSIGYLSAYVLSKTLKPLLEAAPQARVLMVSGGGAIVLRKLLDFNDMQLTKSYNAPKAAARAVHAKTVLAQVLDEQWSDTKITVNSFHPGIIRGSLGRNLPAPLSLGFKVASLLMPKECKTGIYAALSPEMEGVSGQFLEGKKRKTLQFSDEYKNNLIETTESMLTVVSI